MTASRLKRIGLVILGIWVLVGIVAFVLWGWPGEEGDSGTGKPVSVQMTL